jgi:hypothetical protein
MAFMTRKILDVRRVGFDLGVHGDSRTPESFAFPACLTSLMEYLGEDVRWQPVHAHGRDWTERFANKEYFVASGMAFGLLWHPDQCFSSMDLTLASADPLRYAFDWAGYDFEVVDREAENREALFARIVASIDAGKPVLAFGIVGPPECSIVCGYDTDKGALLGWSHFQSHAPADCVENGMFLAENWYDGLWRVVFCGKKGTPVRDLGDVIRRGLEIMSQIEIRGYLAGSAAYDAWIEYVRDPAYSELADEDLRARYQFHRLLVGNHAEARCYLGNFLSAMAGDNENLQNAARCFAEIHDTCWQVWDAAGGLNAPDAYQALRDAAKREEIADLLGRIKALDHTAQTALQLSHRDG